MSLHPPTNRKERLLIFGPSGAGKSSTWVALLDWMRRTQSTAHLYLGDTDHAWEAMRPEDGCLDPFVTVSTWNEDKFQEWSEEIRKWTQVAAPEDWLIVDSVDRAWTAANQRFWTVRGGGDMLAEIMLNAKNKGELSGPHGENWGYINALYRNFAQALLEWPGHLLLVTPAKARIEGVNDQSETGRDKDFAKFGWLPEGQKGLKGLAHSVLLCQETPSGYTYTTIKERGPINLPKRASLKGELVEDSDFVRKYLIPIAGWRP